MITLICHQVPIASDSPTVSVDFYDYSSMEGKMEIKGDGQLYIPSCGGNRGDKIIYCEHTQLFDEQMRGCRGKYN